LSIAVTVSIFFGFAIGFGQFFKKNRGLGLVSVFMVPNVNHTQNKL